MRRNTEDDGGNVPMSGWIQLARYDEIQADTVFEIPSGYTELGFWIVGGGGGGHGDYNKADNSGQGGNGGQARAFEAPLLSGHTCVITVGAGGNGGDSKSNGQPGGRSYVRYNGFTYMSDGGYGGTGTGGGTLQEKQDYSGCGGRGAGYGYKPDSTDPLVQYFFDGKAGEGADYDATNDNRCHHHGGDGQTNPFDPMDMAKYGAGGGGGFDSYRHGASYPDCHGDGGDSGGGNGGYGRDNVSTNTGGNGTFFGAGGGGAAFSSGHTKSKGGAGHCGCVIIYAR